VRVVTACLFLVMLLTGCSSLRPTSNGGPPAAEAQARADIRAAIPAIEAFRADNGTFAGVTVSGLRTTYDVRVPDVGIVVMSPDSYCVESDVEGLTYSLLHPRGDVRPGACPEAPPQPPAAADQLRTVAVVMEVWYARHGSFAGVTPRWLESRIPGLRPVRVVEAKGTSYCIELTGQGHTYAARGPSGDVSVGRC
jgi:hypothetical protein